MAYYITCPFCKANLDPGETCDCREEKGQGAREGRSEDAAQGFHKMMVVGRGGQMRMNFMQEVDDV